MEPYPGTVLKNSQNQEPRNGTGTKKQRTVPESRTRMEPRTKIGLR